MARSIVITGASSGIGSALAEYYAAPGVRLGLLGRNRDRLDAVAAECISRGADVVTGAIDVGDRTGMARWLAAFGDIDLVIANAGVMVGTPPGGVIEPADAGYAAMQINTLGVLNVAQPCIDLMLERGRGQIAIMSSVAAFSPLPDAPSYAASKAAVLSYGLSLRAALSPHGIRVNTICCGFVDTPMARQEHGWQPQTVTAERAAALIARGLARDRAMIVFPSAFAWLVRFGGWLPDRLRGWALRRARFTVSERD